MAAVAWYIRGSAGPAEEPPEAARFRPPGEPGQPHVEITAGHRLDRVLHKAPSGLSPLEIVSTPQGMVRVRRTFGFAGQLFKKEATLDGQPVPRR